MEWISNDELTFYIICILISMGVSLSKTYRNGSYKTVRLWISNAIFTGFLSLMCISIIIGGLQISGFSSFQEMRGHILFIGLAIAIGSAGKKQQEMLEKASISKVLGLLVKDHEDERRDKNKDS